MHSKTLTFFCVLAFFSAQATAAPVPWTTTKGNAYTGAGGKASGGSLNDSPSGNGILPINIFSNNGGNGGDASSGDALAVDASKTNSPDSPDVEEGSGSLIGGGLLNIVTGLGDGQRINTGNTV
ncbi:hypothetical protein B0H10DRAFT_1995674 [Mycena sp. CBHHK59/15]|nr:hypothetical protein B0H10DRAFT_1995674 [Mycena sp. CBHHK59/15]